jgi:valine dehydrogenase (NAD+)
MDIVARECQFVTGRTAAYGGSGDSAVLTAFGVMEGMRAAAEHVWGKPELNGRRVGVCGVGKVGRRLTEHLLAEGASVVVADTDSTAVDGVRDQHPEVESAQVVCGAANNQLAHPGIDKLLHDRGILYAPDYVVNAGGLIQVADAIDGFSEPRARRRAGQIFDTTRVVFALAEGEGIPSGQAADRIAVQRMREIGRLRSLWLPSRP